jgi:hypothetical protein
MAAHMTDVRFRIPSLRVLARHAGPYLVEATIIPLALFYLCLWTGGIWLALGVALGWSYMALLRRVVARRRIPGLLVMGAIGLTTRTIVAVSTGSVFIYFLQPTLTTVVVAGAFLLSVPAGRPLAARLAADFCPLPPAVLSSPHVRRFFSRITLLWAFVNLSNAAGTIYLLLTRSVGTYLVTKTVLSLALTGGGIAVSTVWFKVSMRRHGILVRAV